MEKRFFVIGGLRLAPGFPAIIAGFENGCGPPKAGVVELAVVRQAARHRGRRIGFASFNVRHPRSSFHLFEMTPEPPTVVGRGKGAWNAGACDEPLRRSPRVGEMSRNHQVAINRH
jgi:hypothetical protein